jgi:hypothetical protein
MSADSACASLQTNSPTTRHFVVNPDGGLADVLVSIRSGFKKPYGLPRTSQVLRFANCQIQPYVSAVMTGQEVVFANVDSVLHKIRLAPMNNPAVNFSLPIGKRGQVLKFSKPEISMQITCDIHPWEFAYLSVLEQPFFAVTDTNGDFVIPNVPAGKYKVRALHRIAQNTNAIVREVTVRSGEIAMANFTLDAPAQ